MDSLAYSLGQMFNTLLSKVGAYFLMADNPKVSGYVLMFFIAASILGMFNSNSKDKSKE